MSELCPEKLARLTPSQRKCVEAVYEHGSRKLAAQAVGLSVRTIEDYLSLARDRIGMRRDSSPVREFMRGA